MSAADDRFVALAELLLAPPPGAPLEAPPEPVPLPAAVAAPADVGDAVRDARLFRARLADAFDHALATLLRELAADVLARELHLAPADVAAIARRLVQEHSAAGPVRVRVSAEDAAIPCDLPVVADPALRAGDAMLECPSGTIDARLGVRLADVLDGVTA